MTLKIGQEIKEKDSTSTFRVISVGETGAFLLQGNTSGGYGSWYTNEDIQQNFILPREKWVPKEGEIYWCVFPNQDVGCITNENIWDKQTISSGNCFPTKKLAEAAAEKIKSLLAEL